MKSNGELTLCENLHMVDAAARRALHGTTIHKQVTTECSEMVAVELVKAGLLRDGGTVAAITERELRANTPAQLRALAAKLAARGFACMVGGELILFLAENDDMIDAEFKAEPRSLGDTMHGLEYLEKTRWGRFRRYGLTEVVPTDTEQLKELKKVRAKNSAKGGACDSLPNPSLCPIPCLTHPLFVTLSVCPHRQDCQGGARGREERHRQRAPEDDRQEDGQGRCVRQSPQPLPKAQSL